MQNGTQTKSHRQSLSLQVKTCQRRPICNIVISSRKMGIKNENHDSQISNNSSKNSQNDLTPSQKMAAEINS